MQPFPSLNTPERGEHTVTIADFAEGQAIAVKPTGADPSEVLARGQRILANPQRYHAAKRNCQHTVSEVICGVAESAAATFALFVTAILAIIGMVIFLRRR